jgi:hypothetical protein
MMVGKVPKNVATSTRFTGGRNRLTLILPFG